MPIPPSQQPRLMAAALVLLAETVHLGWEALHGDIRVHHLLQRADMPGLHNAWGLLVLPLLAWWTVQRVQRRGADRAQWRTGFAIAMALGLALSTSFQLRLESLTAAIFITALAGALLLRGHRAECLLGWVLGMLWTFGALLPLAIGGVVAGVSALLHMVAWPALQRLLRQLRHGQTRIPSPPRPGPPPGP